MPTAVSSTEVPVTRGSAVATALGDLLTLLRFRARTARRGRERGAIAAFVVLTAAVAIAACVSAHLNRMGESSATVWIFSHASG